MRTFGTARWTVRGLAGVLVVASAMSLVAAPGLGTNLGLVSAQETPASKTGEAKSTKKRTEPRGRLPAHFGEVISNEQREKIYDVQAKYSAQISKLQDEITKLEETRDKEVMAVLTAEQVAKVKALQEEAKAKRAANSGRKKGDGQGSDGDSSR